MIGTHTRCDAWDYEDHPQRAKIGKRCRKLEKLIRARPHRFDRYGFDTRPGHRFLFAAMTPPSCPELAGGFRGSAGALEFYPVGVHGDPSVGTPAGFVAMSMSLFEEHCKDLVAAFELLTGPGAKSPSPAALLVRFGRILCDLLEELFRIHPYANGNGHAGRLFLFVMALRHGFHTYAWHIDPRPPYGTALVQYRNGKRSQLEKLVIEALSGGPLSFAKSPKRSSP